jgi:GntR family transcriptional regulator
MTVDETSSVPLYLQVVDLIATAVSAGVYKAGDVLPSVRQQAITLLVNPNTVQRAYEALEQHGVLTTRRGGAPIVANGGADVAKSRLTDTVRGTFVDGIKTGRAAGIHHLQIDNLYHLAWSGLLRPNAPASVEEQP